MPRNTEPELSDQGDLDDYDEEGSDFSDPGVQSISARDFARLDKERISVPQIGASIDVYKKVCMHLYLSTVIEIF